MHEKKTKGDLFVVPVIARLTELQWNVGILITEHAKYDLLAEKEGKMIRVQVKTGRIRNGSVRTPLGVVAQIVTEAIPLLSLMRDQKTKAPVPHPQLAAL